MPLLRMPAGAETTPRTTPIVAVGAQYDTAHVYVARQDVERFIASFVATFGGTSSAQSTVTVTPVPSTTISQIASTPVGTVSVFGYETPAPYLFGSERTGYLVTDMDVAVDAARASGAAIVVAPFDDPIGRDAIVEWPGGVYMQLYWHTTAPHYPAFVSVPENRVYLSRENADAFVRDFVAFSHGTVVADDTAPGAEIGRPHDTYRRIRVESTFGKLVVLVTDGHLPYPYGRETTGYEVPDLDATLVKATVAGATVLVPPATSQTRRAAIVRFPGGYVAEVHSLVGR
ncbi:MAG: glyoxalase [Candidatus Eremiobacteraeota bacterium]|nr:glyoxalase [Candidatus Eremiobacteraeota bacterium]